MENIMLLLLGIFIAVIGIVNMTGNISTIHSYNRRRVKEEDIPKYGRAIGFGTLLIGISLVIAFILLSVGLGQFIDWVILPAAAIGIGIILYAQFKYNKGIF